MQEGHCSVVDALVLASKYGFEELVDKALKFITEHPE